MNPQSDEVGDVTNTSISHLVGQRGVIDQVRVALDASHQDNMSFPTSLLVGPPGCGKSQLASVISSEVAGGFHEVLGQSLRNIGDLHLLLLKAQHKDVVHLDEAHQIPRLIMTALYLCLDQKCIVLGGKGTSPQKIYLHDFTLLMSTTDEYGLLAPLRDRCRLLLRFDYYSEDELATIIVRRSKALGWDVHESLFPEISKRSRGTPRLALRLLQSCRRCSRAEGECSIKLSHLHRACQLEQLDELGLGPTERKYLEILFNGANRLNVIASMLGLPSKTVAEVIEPYLIRSELVTKDDGKRILTAFGRGHVDDCRQSDD